MKKIGIVTFFYAKNYGGVLQAYSLFKYLENSGHPAEFINYVPGGRTGLKSWLGLVRSLVTRTFIDRKKKAADVGTSQDFARIFDKFVHQNLSLSRPVSSLQELKSLAEDYSVIISGSDQIWNTNLVRQDIHYFLLGFARGPRKISYASCIGQPDQLLQQYGQQFELLRQYEHVAVRNSISQELAQQHVEEVTQVCDPVLLIDHTDLEQPYPLGFDKYIVVYALNEHTRDLLDYYTCAVKEKLNLPVVVIHSKYKFSLACGDKVIADATPGQWIRLISKASFIVTDSFHGVLFAIKAQREFIAISGNEWRSHRLIDIANKYHFERRCVQSRGDLEHLSLSLNYRLVNESVAHHVALSKNYLQGALKDD
ncbi:MAG: polysaccharide pyruvyl transferase family protein [bacterium]|nr:polysaccharide pyruvyl transferase family protein [bacterium]